jgi:hypothetical protein
LPTSSGSLVVANILVQFHLYRLSVFTLGHFFLFRIELVSTHSKARLYDVQDHGISNTATLVRLNDNLLWKLGSLLLPYMKTNGGAKGLLIITPKVRRVWSLDVWTQESSVTKALTGWAQL